MELTPEIIVEAVEKYNQVTEAHKRPPVFEYVKKKLEAGESVEVLSGYPRWSCALRFSGSPKQLKIDFVINESLPEAMKNLLEKKKNDFQSRLRSS